LAGRSGQAPRALKLLVGQANYVQETLAQLDLLPGEFALLPNFPNPFNPTTTIRYALPAAAKVDLAIYNLLGQKIATLLREAPGEAGYHSVIWNGRDDAGQPVASGIYFLHLRAGAHRAVRKMILLK
ncbi:MAG: T9SS type A sorting domain-containing protein, partial [Calditrichaeota bacterium]|nr:T9SS type A sorting domain-containing protein [Calditrichota bacterium]